MFPSLTNGQCRSSFSISAVLEPTAKPALVAHLLWATVIIGLVAGITSGTARADDLRVGVIGPFTPGHPSSYLGESFKQALDLAKAQLTRGAPAWLDAQRELPGKIIFIERDDQSDPAIAAQQAEELIRNEHVHLILGSADSHSSEAVASVCEFFEVPHLIPISTAVEIVRPAGWTLRVALSNRLIIDTLLTHLSANMQGCHLVYGYADTVYGRDLHKQTQQLIGEKHLTNATGFSFPQALSTSYFEQQAAPLVRELKNTHAPLCIGLFLLSRDAARLAQVVRAANIDGTFIVAPGNASEPFLELAGPAAEGTVSMASFYRDSPTLATKPFVDDYETATLHSPDCFAAQVYDSVHVLANAYANLAAHGAELTRSALYKELRASRVWGVTGHVTFKGGEREIDLHEVSVLVACRGTDGLLSFRPNGICRQLATAQPPLDHTPEPAKPGLDQVPSFVWPALPPLALFALLLFPPTRRWALSIQYKPIRGVALMLCTSPLVRKFLHEPYAHMKRTSLPVVNARTHFFPLPLRGRGRGAEVFEFDIARLLQAPSILLGPSGAGKTRGLERIFQQILDGKVRCGLEPFLVDARAFEDDLCKLAAQSCKYGRTQILPDYVEAYARQKSLLLLIDDACGLSGVRRAKLRDELKRLVETGNHVILAAREQLTELERMSFVVYELAPVPDKQLDAYLRLYLPAEPDRRDLIEKLGGERLRALPRTPLMLELVAKSYRSHGRIASTTTGVYADYAAVLIAGLPEVDPDGARFILQQLAYNFYWQSGGRRGFSKPELLDFIDGLEEQLRVRSVTATPTVLVRELRKAGLLRESVGRLSFSHDALEDFLCAEHLYEMVVAKLMDEASVLLRSDTGGFEETYVHLHGLLGDLTPGTFDALRKTIRDRCCPSLRAAATQARSALISSAEMSACWRSEEPEISLDKLSGQLSSSDGHELAHMFREDTAPKIGRQVALRARVFLEVSQQLLQSGQFDACISLGSGLSMLTSLLAQRTGRALRFYDADLPTVISERERRIKEKGFKAPRCVAFDLEHSARDKRGLGSLFDESAAALFDGRRRPLILMEGLLSFLTPTCRTWLFDKLRNTNGAVLFDYWAGDDQAEFRDMQQFFNTQAVTEDLHKLELSSLVEQLPDWNQFLDLDTAQRETQLVKDKEQRKLGGIGPAGAADGLSMRLVLLAHPSLPSTIAERIAGAAE